MSKPLLWMTAGFGWCATSPLAYTLQYNSKYVSSGYFKEGPFLWCLDKFYRINGPKKNEKHESRWTYRENMLQKLKELAAIKIEDTPRCQQHRFNADDYVPNLDKIWVEPYTFDQYIDYLYATWDVVKENGYKGVADFGNAKRWLSEEFWEENANKLKEHFDVKVGIIVRDPIRRAWSGNYTRHSGDVSKIFHKNDSGFDYLPAFERYNKHFDTILLVMEELWEGDGSEKKRLESFIDYKLGDLHRNMYAPDRGHLIDEIDPNLTDQSEKLPELTPELYMEMREGLYAPVYEEWKNRFGKLPLYWGAPLEYK